MAFDVEEYIKERRKKQTGNTTTTDKESFDVEEYIKQRRTPEVANTISSRFQNWLSDYDSLTKDYNSRYSNVDTSVYRGDTEDWLAKLSERTSNHFNEGQEIKSMVEQYKNYLDPEWVSSFYDALTNANKMQRDMVSGAKKEKDYWSQWDSEAHYNYDYDNYTYGTKYEGKTYADIQKAIATAEGREKDWLSKNADSYMTSADAQAEIDRLKETYKEPSWFESLLPSYETTVKAVKYAEAQDRIAVLEGIRDNAKRTEQVEKYNLHRGDNYFSKYAQMGADMALPTMEEVSAYENKMYEYAENASRLTPEEQAEYHSLIENGVIGNKLKYWRENPYGLDPLSGTTQTTYSGMYELLTEGNSRNWKYLEPEEEEMYNYILAFQGAGAADKYLDDIQWVLDKRATDARNTSIQNAIKNSSGFEGFLVNSALSVASIPAKIIGGVTSFLDNSVHQFKGESINPYSNMQSFRNFANTVRGEVGSEIADTATWELFGQNVMEQTYNAMMSMGDSVVGAVTLGHLYTFVAGSGAAADKSAELYERGASNGQIFWGGITSGVAEAVFEYVSIDKLLSEKSVKNIGQYVLEVLKQAGVEGSEEVATEIANLVSEGIIMGSNSDLSMSIKKYEEGYYDENGNFHEGISHEEAKKKALTDKVTDVVWAGISGMMSGGMSSGIMTGAQAVQGAVAENNALIGMGQNIMSSTNGYNALKNLATEVSSEGLVKNEANIKKLVDKTQTGVDAYNKGTASKHQANKTAKQVGKLSQAVNSVRNEQNLAEIRSSLESKGLSKSQAKKAAQLLNEALYSDGAYSEELYKSVMNDEGVWDTLRELISAPDSSVKNRNLKHQLGRMGLKVGEDGSIVSSVKAEATKSKYVDESLSFIEDVSKREYKTSTEGKSIVNTTGETIDIVEVASIENGQMMLKVKDADGAESVVNARDVSYSNESEALVYEAVANMGLNAVSANSIIQSYNPTQDAATFARGVQEAYRYGKYNYSEYEMYQDGNFLTELSEEQIQKAYKLGQIQSGSDTAVAVAKLKEAIANSKGKKGEGKVHFEGDAVNIDVESLNDRQKTGLKTMEMLSKALGINFYVYASSVNEKGERVYKTATGEEITANGIYDKATGAIHIDLNAGETGEGTMLFTIAHELTHFIKAWSPAKFKVLANFLVEQYGKKGVSVEVLVRRQMANMKANGRKNVTYDKAFEEFVADSMQTMLTSGNVVNDLAEIKRRDEGLWNKIKEFFTDFVDNLKKTVEAYSGFAPDTIEGQTVAEMTDAIERLEKLFTEALVDASENFRAISYAEQQTLAEVGIGFDEDTRSVHSLRFSTGRKDALGNVIDLVSVGKKNFNTEAIAQLVAKGTGRSIEDARKWVNSEITIANIVMNNPEFLDFEADDRYEAIKKNSDYPQGTVDLSNLCPKRTEFTAMFDMLQKKYPDKLFTANDVAAMRNILKEKGITVACGACFVEDRRQLLGEIADTYIGMWKEAVETGKPLQKVNASGNKVTLTVTAALAKQYGLTKGSEILATDKYIPTQYDLTTYEGFKLLEKNHPTIAMGFNRYNNSRGQQAGRLIEGRAEYNRQILGWSPTKVKTVNNNGGLRIFSFSDFEVVHLLDLVQVIIDCSAMGVKIQGYTKIPSFARLVRDTGIKINRSLIPKGQTGMKMVDGKQVLDYDTTEGIDINDENFIDERDNPNVGNILIGINPTQIGLAMLDDFVDYIIPFHTNKSKDICKALGLAEWVNYKESQHEKDIDTDKASKHNVNIYTEVINKYNPTNKKEFVDAFLKVCKAQKKIPRYSEFLNKEYKADGAYTDEYGSFDFTYREGYHKLIVDFKMFDRNGNILPQGEITPNLDEGFMSKLLKAEVDKKQNYEFPQEVYEQLDKEFGESATDNLMLSDRNIKLTDADLDEYMQVGKKLRTRNNKRRLLDSGKKPILTSTEEVSLFMSDVVCGKALGEVRAFAKVGTRLANAVLGVDGSMDVLGDYMELPADDLRESYKRHSSPKEKGDIPLRASDFERIPEYLDDFDGVLLTSYYHGKKEIHLYKETDEGYVRILAVSSNERGSLLVTKLIGVSKEKFEAKYAKKMERNIGSPRGQSEKSDASNPPTGARLTADVLSETIVPQSPNSVKTPDENPHSDRNKPRSAKEQRDGGYMLSESKFYQLYSAHKLDIGKRWGDVEKQIEDIKTNGFQGGSGAVNVIPAGAMRISNFLGVSHYELYKKWEAEGKVEKGYAENFKKELGEEYGKPILDNVIQKAYGPKKGDYVILVPNHMVEGGRKVKQGFKPFDYEVVKVERDYQPYYELYEKAYKEYENTTDGEKLFSDRNKDSKGNTLSKEQTEFFKDSKVRDKDGNLLVVYHGTPKNFTVFRQGVASGWGKGIYFTDNRENAAEYGDNVVEAYLNITNPFYADKVSYNDIGAENTKAYRDFDMKVWKERYDEYDTYEEYVADGMGVDMYEIYTEEIEVFNKILRELGYDGIIADGSNNIDGLEIVAFNESQPKLTTNSNPTSDPDIRYSDRNKNSVSNRSLLANALESAVTNEFERKTLNDYKEELGRADALEKELGEIRSKIRELSFAKGPKDTEALKKLREQEVKTVNRIDIRDKKLLRLEATKPLKDIIHRERDKAYKRAEKEGKEALARHREKTAETQREMLSRWQESRHKAVEGRNKTAMRHKIKGVVSELNKLLLHGTKDNHVMIGLQKAVASALDAVNMDTVGADERVAKYNELIAKAKDPDVIESLTASRDRILAQGEKIGERLANLKNAYSEIKNSDDPLIANSYDEVISSKMEAVVASVGNTPLRNMSLSQLEDVYDLYKMVLTTIRNSNKAFKAKKGEEISVLGNRVMEEVESAGGKKDKSLKLLDGVKQYGWSILKPVYAFKLIGSKTFSEVYDNVRRGEDTWARDVDGAIDFRTTTQKKYNYKKWDFNKKHKFTAKSGVTFELTLEQMLSLYAYSKRKQADDHLEKGGFVFDTAIEVIEKKHGIPLKYNVNTATAHQLSKETLADIIGNLTEEQKGFVDEMQDYLSTVMGEKGNEVSLEMYGVKLFKEKFYFPLKSARQFLFEQNEVAGEVKIKNSGFSKETVAHANNPIILDNFMDVWANHVNDMSMYHSFVLPLEDFNRVYNYKTPTTDNMQTESVKMYLQNAYGTQASSYIKQLLTDLNGGARSDPQAGIFNKALGKFKKAKVFASMSVVIQQPSAIGRAIAYIDPKYFVGKKVSKSEQMKTWSEVKKYAPVAIIKEMGYFDVGNGRSTVSFLKGDKSIMDRVDDVASWLPAKADEITWCAIWEAVKREVADKNEALKADPEALRKAAGERFTEVITNTQVYDSVLSRSGMMRSKDTLVKMATAFMAEPTTTMNMMVEATLEGKRGNKKVASKLVGGAVASILLNSILVAFVYAARDDDEDETYAEKYLGSLTAELMDGFNPLTYLPIVKDLWSIGQGFDVERSDVSLFADLIDSFKNLFNEDASALDKVMSFTGDVTNLFGLPFKNVWRDVEALYNVAKGIIDGTQTTTAGIGYSVMDSVRNTVPVWGWIDKGSSKGDKLYNALISGNQAQIDRIKGGYEDDKAYENAVKQAIRENDKDVKNQVKAFLSGDFTGVRSAVETIASRYGISEELADAIIDAEYDYYKSKIDDAAKALKEGNTTDHKDIVKTLRERYRGVFSQDEIVNAIKEKSEKLEESTETEKKEESVYEAWQINSALEKGDIDTATTIIEDLVRVKTENNFAKAKAEAEKNGKKFNEKTARKEAESKARSSVKSSVSSHWKPIVKAAKGNNTELLRIRDLLFETGLYGRTYSEVWSTMKDWLKS